MGGFGGFSQHAKAVPLSLLCVFAFYVSGVCGWMPLLCFVAISMDGTILFRDALRV
jgi:hypothetical protein